MIRLYRIGSLAVDTEIGIKTCFCKPTTAGNIMTCEYPFSTDFQVTPGKTFYVCYILHSNGTANATFAVGYGDDGVNDGGAAPTNPIRITEFISARVAHEEYKKICFLPIPGGKYPYVSSPQGTSRVTLMGIEV